jgi:ABC-type dipeptide/oligopeptide/nickel transport system permease component
MVRYIIRRLLWLPVVLLAVSFITFTLGYYAPGDPVEVMLGQRVNPAAAERLREELGLNRPFFERYTDFVLRAVNGDFGESYKYRGQPVADLIADKVWVSVQLGLAGLALAFAIGIPLGILAALKQGTWLDDLIVGTTLVLNSIPVFFTLPMLLLIFVRTLRWLPSSGWGGLFDSRIIIPAVVMALPGLAVITRQMRASTLDVLYQDYVRVARAKGLPESTVMVRHVVRNALLPLWTILGLSLGGLVEGFFVIETLYGIPGIGAMAVDSMFTRDYPVIMAITLLVATSFVLANLLVDIGYTFLDPRIRYD